MHVIVVAIAEVFVLTRCTATTNVHGWFQRYYNNCIDVPIQIDVYRHIAFYSNTQTFRRCTNEPMASSNCIVDVFIVFLLSAIQFHGTQTKRCDLRLPLFLSHEFVVSPLQKYANYSYFIFILDSIHSTLIELSSKKSIRLNQFYSPRLANFVS